MNLEDLDVLSRPIWGLDTKVLEMFTKNVSNLLVNGFSRLVYRSVSVPVLTDEVLVNLL